MGVFGMVTKVAVMHGFPKPELGFGGQKEKQIERGIGQILPCWKQAVGKFLPFGNAS